MRIPTLCAAAAAALLLGFAGNAMAANHGKTETMQTRSVPVLVFVGAHGNVTRLVPAFKIGRHLRRALKETLSAVITQPAHNKKGQAIANRVAMVVPVSPVKQKDGTYTVHFGYASAKPVPAGQWIWWYNAGKYSLVNTDTQIRSPQRVADLSRQAHLKAAWARENRTSPINY